MRRENVDKLKEREKEVMVWQVDKIVEDMLCPYKVP